MSMKKTLVFLMFVVALQISSLSVLAQQENASAKSEDNVTEKKSSVAMTESKRDAQQPKRVGLEISFHLFITGNAGQSGKIPSSLDGVAKEIRQSLNVNSLSLTTTLLHRVESGSGLEVRGVSTTSLSSTPSLQALPTFYNYGISRVLLGDDMGAQDIIRLERVYYSTKIPMYTSPGAESLKAVNYEQIAINTSATVKENEPTIIGTTNIGRPDETLVVVMTVKRVTSR